MEITERKIKENLTEIQEEFMSTRKEFEEIQNKNYKIINSGVLEYFEIDDFEVDIAVIENIFYVLKKLIEELKIEVECLNEVSNVKKVISEDKIEFLIDYLDDILLQIEAIEIDTTLEELEKLICQSMEFENIDKYKPKMNTKYRERLNKISKYINKKSFTIKKKYTWKEIEEETGITKSKIDKALEWAKKHKEEVI